MKIIVLSDTHLASDLPEEIAGIIKSADMVVHAGDFVTRKAYENIKALNMELIAVSGNSDDADLKAILPESLTFEAEGIKIGVIHKGRFGTDSTNMMYLAMEMGVDVLIYGHLHRPIIEKQGPLLVCPGSPTSPRMSDPTMVELTIEKGKINGKILKMSAGNVCSYIGFMRSLQE